MLWEYIFLKKRCLIVFLVAARSKRGFWNFQYRRKCIDVHKNSKHQRPRRRGLQKSGFVLNFVCSIFVAVQDFVNFTKECLIFQKYWMRNLKTIWALQKSSFWEWKQPLLWAEVYSYGPFLLTVALLNSWQPSVKGPSILFGAGRIPSQLCLRKSFFK